MCWLWPRFDTDVPPTRFVAEEHSEVPNNPVDQLPSNVWHLRYATRRNGFSHECVCYGLDSALKCLLRGVLLRESLYRTTPHFNWRLMAESWKLQTQKSPTLSNRAFSYLEPGDDLLSHSSCYTIIGAVSFHYWVRHGVRWVQNAIVTN